MRLILFIFLFSSGVSFGQSKAFFKLDDAQFEIGAINRTKLDNSIHVQEWESYYEKNEDQFKLIIQFLNDHPTLLVELGFYENASSKQKKNVKNAQEAAEIIVAKLVELGVEKDQIVAKGYGDVDQFPDVQGIGQYCCILFSYLQN